MTIDPRDGDDAPDAASRRFPDPPPFDSEDEGRVDFADADPAEVPYAAPAEGESSGNSRVSWADYLNPPEVAAESPSDAPDFGADPVSFDSASDKDLLRHAREQAARDKEQLGLPQPPRFGEGDADDVDLGAPGASMYGTDDSPSDLPQYPGAYGPETGTVDLASLFAGGDIEPLGPPPPGYGDASKIDLANPGYDPPPSAPQSASASLGFGDDDLPAYAAEDAETRPDPEDGPRSSVLEFLMDDGMAQSTAPVTGGASDDPFAGDPDDRPMRARMGSPRPAEDDMGIDADDAFLVGDDAEEMYEAVSEGGFGDASVLGDLGQPIEAGLPGNSGLIDLQDLPEELGGPRGGPVSGVALVNPLDLEGAGDWSDDPAHAAHARHADIFGDQPSSSMPIPEVYQDLGENASSIDLGSDPSTMMPFGMSGVLERGGRPAGPLGESGAGMELGVDDDLMPDDIDNAAMAPGFTSQREGTGEALPQPTYRGRPVTEAGLKPSSTPDFTARGSSGNVGRGSSPSMHDIPEPPAFAEVMEPGAAGEADYDAPAYAGRPEQPAPNGRALLGWVGGLVLGVGGIGGAWLGGFLPESPKLLTSAPKTAVVASNGNGGTPAAPKAVAKVPTPEDARALFDAGDVVAAIGLYQQCNSNDKKVVLGRAQAKWLQLLQVHAKDGKNVSPEHPDVDLIRQDLAIVRDQVKDKEKLDGPREAQAAQAALWLGVLEESLGRFDDARKVYAEALGEFSETHKRLFEAGKARVELLAPAAGEPVGLRPDALEAHLALSLTLLQPGDDESKPDAPKPDAPKPEAAPEAAEPGFKFWEALLLAKAHRYADAKKALAEAKALHQKRAALAPGRRLNPDSDPLERIFVQSCAELEALWTLRESVYGSPAVGEIAKKDGISAALDRLVKGGAKLEAEKKELADQIAKLAEAFKEGGIDAATLDQGLTDLFAARKKAEADAKKAQDDAKSVADTLAGAGLKGDDAAALAESAVARIKAIDGTLAGVAKALKDASLLKGEATPEALRKAVGEAVARAKAPKPMTAPGTPAETEAAMAAAREELDRVKKESAEEIDALKAKLEGGVAKLEKQLADEKAAYAATLEKAKQTADALAADLKKADEQRKAYADNLAKAEEKAAADLEKLKKDSAETLAAEKEKLDAAKVEAEKALADAKARVEAEVQKSEKAVADAKAKADAALKEYQAAAQVELAKAKKDADARVAQEKAAAEKRLADEQAAFAAKLEEARQAADSKTVARDPKAARESLDRLLGNAAPDQKPALLLKRARLSASEGRLDDALVDAVEARNLDATAESVYVIGQVYEQQGKPILAQEAYREALKTKGLTPELRSDIRIAIGRLLLGTRPVSASPGLPVPTPAATNVRWSDATHSTLMLTLVTLMVAQPADALTPEALIEALEIAEEQIKEGRPQGHFLKARVLLQQAQHNAALLEFQKGLARATALTRDEADLLSRILASHPALRQLDPAIRPDTAEASRLYGVGTFHYYRGEYGPAEEALKRSVQFFGAAVDARPVYFLGLTLLAQGKTAEAEAVLKRGGDLEAKGFPPGELVDESLVRIQGTTRAALDRYRP